MIYYKQLFERYYVGEDGSIYDCMSGYDVTQTINAGGYYVVWLELFGKRKQFKHHRMVAIAFLPNPEGKRFVNHKDRDKLNNVPSNLEWCTHAENMRHAKETGFYSGSVKRIDIVNNRKQYRDMAKKLKNIKLEEDVLTTLFKQALDKGFNNLQNYLEHVLIEKSKEK